MSTGPKKTPQELTCGVRLYHTGGGNDTEGDAFSASAEHPAGARRSEFIYKFRSFYRCETARYLLVSESISRMVPQCSIFLNPYAALRAALLTVVDTAAAFAVAARTLASVKSTTWRVALVRLSIAALVAAIVDFSAVTATS
ncbi:MAG: hypothetical protein ABI854_06030, partial [Betaproteobacteria bacterium]